MSIASETAPAPAPTSVAATPQTDKAGAVTSQPPSTIVSDIPGVRTTPAAPATPAASAPSVNGLAFRSGASPAPPTKMDTNTNTNTNTRAEAGIVKWRLHRTSTPVHTPTSSKKVPIMNAPGSSTPPTAPQSTSGFPSPGRESFHKLPKFVDDRTRITFGIQQAIPEATRRAIRDNWEKCLIGSDFHQAFVLNATIHHAKPEAVRRGIEGFGKKMISDARNEIMDQMSTADLDDVAVRILSKASNSFLDKALEMRLKTIEAKHLINALARAERLGYEPSDVQDDGDLPATSPFPAADTTMQHSDALPRNVAHSQPDSPAPAPGLPPHCSICFRRFFVASAHAYHMKHRVCTRPAPANTGFKYSCQHCGQGFTTVAGLNYHTTNNTCLDKERAVPPKSHAGPSPHAATPTAGATAARQSHSYSTPRPSPATQDAAAPSSSSPNVPDPYAHLSREQLTALQADLNAAEVEFTARIREANAMPDEEARKLKLNSLSNCFSTKQSLIRKKYGIRLRMRRSKEEIQAERNRMTYKTPSELQAEMGIVNPGIKVKAKSQQNTGSSTQRNGHSSGLHTPGHTSTPSPTTTLASSLPVPQNNSAATNDVSMHGSGGGHKRSYTGDGESPSHKRIAYAEMGGLGGDVTMPAETRDPTMPAEKQATVAAVSKEVENEEQGASTAEEPIVLDDSGTASGDNDDVDEDDDNDSDSSNGDDDIPAQLPASVLQSLQRSSRTATASPKVGST